MASDTSKSKAPDGGPWPNPRLAIDTAEQRPWSFGHVPAPWQHEGARGPVHFGQVDAGSLVNTMLGGPWHTERANLETGDVQLLGPDGLPIDGAFVCERKSMADLRGSLSTGHARLMAEMERMSPWRTPVVIVEAPIEVLIGDVSGMVRALDDVRAWICDVGAEHAGTETGERAAEWSQWIGRSLGLVPEDAARPGRVTVQSLLGSTLSILTDHRIPALFLPSRAWAEYACAWIARRAWRRWLLDNPSGLAAERERQAAERHAIAAGVVGDAAEARAQAVAPLPAVRLDQAGGMTASSAGYADRKRVAREAEVGR